MNLFALVFTFWKEREGLQIIFIIIFLYLSSVLASGFSRGVLDVRAEDLNPESKLEAGKDSWRSIQKGKRI